LVLLVLVRLEGHGPLLNSVVIHLVGVWGL
jgi:hypothetical protein